MVSIQHPLNVIDFFFFKRNLKCFFYFYDATPRVLGCFKFLHYYIGTCSHSYTFSNITFIHKYLSEVVRKFLCLWDDFFFLRFNEHGVYLPDTPDVEHWAHVMEGSTFCNENFSSVNLVRWMATRSLSF